MAEYSPWVEKYRPSCLEDVILDKINKEILGSIIQKGIFPNLLLYGPPGTGKTTTIINLINSWQTKQGQKGSGLKIHLNASDDRGIDVVRNQINQFVHTKPLFQVGMKFVILDEIDYMTKNAQHALRYLIHLYSGEVRFCLICNYISRVDKALQNEFIRLRFCRLPPLAIHTFLNRIKKAEDLDITSEQVERIQQLFGSDIRSMINFIQSNHMQFKNGIETDMVRPECWTQLIELFLEPAHAETVRTFIETASSRYNIGIGNFVRRFISHILSAKDYTLGRDWVRVSKYIVHHDWVREEYIVDYFILRFGQLYRSL